MRGFHNARVQEKIKLNLFVKSAWIFELSFLEKVESVEIGLKNKKRAHCEQFKSPLINNSILHLMQAFVTHV